MELLRLLLRGRQLVSLRMLGPGHLVAARTAHGGLYASERRRCVAVLMIGRMLGRWYDDGSFQSAGWGPCTGGAWWPGSCPREDRGNPSRCEPRHLSVCVYVCVFVCVCGKPFQPLILASPTYMVLHLQVSPRLLTSRLSDAQGRDALLAIVEQHGAYFNAIHVSTCLNR
jgi:hypothetical protein